MNKIFLSIITVFSLSVGIAFAETNVTYTPNWMSGDDIVDEILTVNVVSNIDTDTGIIYYSQVDGLMLGWVTYLDLAEPTVNGDEAVGNIFSYGYRFDGGVVAYSIDMLASDMSACVNSATPFACAGTNAEIEYLGQVFYMGTLSQPATALFSFVDRNVSNGTGASTSAILVRGTSNLWPLIIIVLGLVMTFYVIDKFSNTFKLAYKKKRKRDII